MSHRLIARRLGFRLDLMPTLWGLLDLRDKICLTHACFLKFRFRKRHVKTAIYWLGDPSFALYVLKFVKEEYAWCRPIIAMMASSDETKLRALTKLYRTRLDGQTLSSFIERNPLIYYHKRWLVKHISLRQLEDIINKIAISPELFFKMNMPKHGNWDREGTRVINWHHHYAIKLMMYRTPLSRQTIKALVEQGCAFKLYYLKEYYGLNYTSQSRCCTCK